MKLKFLTISDTHLGEDCSLLAFPDGRWHLWRALRGAFSDQLPTSPEGNPPSWPSLLNWSNHVGLGLRQRVGSLVSGPHQHLRHLRSQLGGHHLEHVDLGRARQAPPIGQQGIGFPLLRRLFLST